MTLQEYLDEYEAHHRNPLNKLTHVFGIPIIVASLPMLVIKPLIGVGMFVGGWILQFLGHHFEGNGPKFFQGPIFLLIGVVWVPYAILKAAGLIKSKA
jgi:uncharacterized membrane protein YGL010W